MSEYQWTLITVVFNNQDKLKEYWSEFTTSREEIEWLVIDNNSDDDSSKVASSLGAEVIKLSRNLGFSAANNIGLASAKGKYVLFANPDLTVQTQDLSKLSSYIDKTSGLVSPQLINSDFSLQPNGRGRASLINKVLSRLGVSRITNSYFKYALPGQEVQVSWLMGAAIAGKKSTFTSLGGWDEKFFLYYEDSDICYRANALGLPITVIGDCRWVHGWARETRGINLRAWRYELKSMLRFYRIYWRELFRIR